jgi:hypothetical protein
MLLLPVGLIGAIRLAKPGSPWANRRYAPGSKKLTKAEKRFGRHTVRYQRFQDRIAGTPHLDGPKTADSERPKTPHA